MEPIVFERIYSRGVQSSMYFRFGDFQGTVDFYAIVDFVEKYLKAENNFDLVDKREYQQEEDNNSEQRDEEGTYLEIKQLKAYELDQCL